MGLKGELIRGPNKGSYKFSIDQYLIVVKEKENLMSSMSKVLRVKNL